MKVVRIALGTSALTLVVLVALYADRLAGPLLNLPPKAAPTIAFVILGVNVLVALAALFRRGEDPRMAGATLGLALLQIVAVLVTS